MPRASASSGAGGSNKRAEDVLAMEEMEEDEVYQYSKAQPGPIFAAIENILRCAVCRGISDPPVSVRCCQTVFCSSCIREYLAVTTPRCPVCRTTAAPHDLVLSKGLRSVCTLWKQNRRSILAAANAGVESEARKAKRAKKKGKKDPDTPSVPKASEPMEPADRLRRANAGGLGATRNRNQQQRVHTIHYHTMKEGKMRALLKSLGLPHTGDKATMEKRHRRLVLLDAASADREAPIPREELVRQVTEWSKEKDREKAAAARQAGSLASTFSASSPSSSNSSRGSSSSAGGAGVTGGVPGVGAGDAEVPSVPPEMKAAFTALIAKGQAQAAARKRAREHEKSTATTTNTDASGAGVDNSSSSSKRARTAEGVSEAQSTARRRVSISAGRKASEGSPVSTPTQEPRKEATGGHDANVPGFGGGGGGGGGGVFVDGGVATQILGVAGRMVRTNGPWRCAFITDNSLEIPDDVEAAVRQSSRNHALTLAVGTDQADDNDGCEDSKGSTPGKKLLAEDAAQIGINGTSNNNDDSASLPVLEDGNENDRAAFSGNAMVIGVADGKHTTSGPNELAVAALPNGQDSNGSNIRAFVDASSKNDIDHSSRLALPDGHGGASDPRRPQQSPARSEEPHNTAKPAEATNSSGRSNSITTSADSNALSPNVSRIKDSSARPSTPSAPGHHPRTDSGSRQLKAERNAEPGILYLNSTTGETAREPPPELRAQSEEAEKSGQYLVFVPNRAFVRALASPRQKSSSVDSVKLRPEESMIIRVNEQKSRALCDARSKENPAGPDVSKEAKKHRMAVSGMDVDEPMGTNSSRKMEHDANVKELERSKAAMLSSGGSIDVRGERLGINLTEGNESMRVNGGSGEKLSSPRLLQAPTSTTPSNATQQAASDGQEAWDRLASAGVVERKPLVRPWSAEESSGSGIRNRLLSTSVSGGEFGSNPVVMAAAAPAGNAKNERGADRGREAREKNLGEVVAAFVATAEESANGNNRSDDVDSEDAVAGCNAPVIDLSQGGNMASPASKPTKLANISTRIGASVGADSALGGKKWACARCTLENINRVRVCDACGSPRPDEQQ